MTRKIILAAVLGLMGLNAQAQRFFNLTSSEVKIDTVLPQFAWSTPLPENYQDSVYTVSIAYPEFIDMTAGDIARYNHISGAALPDMPEVTLRTVVTRKRGALEVSFCPLVFRDNRYQILVSFMLKVEAKAVRHSVRRALVAAHASHADRYAEHSVLATGTWAKIRVPSTGVYQLTDALVRNAGFTDLSHVRIYGYGGNLQNERLNGDELAALDDLQEVPTCTVGGRRLFYAKGPVSWSSNTAARRTRNPYSDYGYYFITQADGTPATIDAEEFLSTYYPSADDYHSLSEVDDYSWYHGGRNLFNATTITAARPMEVTLPRNPNATRGILSVNVTSNSRTQVEVSFNDSVVGRLYISLSEYDQGNESSGSFQIRGLSSTCNVKIAVVSGGVARLDYVSMAWNQPFSAPDLTSGTFPVPEYVYNITNQDHHADGFADMVIIIPTSQKLLSEAQRLKAFHESHDSLRVNIVPADELYNEFSSGTPDANAYRRYLKMLYDRAENDADMPRYLLLFGDCVWDNRMLTSDCKNLSPDDYLLAFESENSFNKVTCYIDDGFYGLLDDGEGADPQASDKLDLAVGRFPVATPEEAAVMVDKTISYVENKNAGAWENTVMVMGDDGDNNLHMTDANDVADDIIQRYPGYLVKKVMWDAYTRESSSTGFTYPEVTRAIKQQQAAGALIMDYAGHGREDQLSHETVLRLTDFDEFSNANLPLWITASCDIMPFDGTSATIGESAVLNKKGGAVAFFGTTRTVYANYNKRINMAYMRYVLGQQDGKPCTIGEAQRLAKNELITTGQDRTTNKLQYSLLGDPAIALNQATMKVVVDSINGVATTSENMPTLRAGSIATIKGHIEGAPDFQGVITATVRDNLELITCKMNDYSNIDEAFTYYDRTKTLYQGSDSVSGGQFRLVFAVPKDINYSNQTGLVNLYAVNDSRTATANGYTGSFLIGGSDVANTDSLGPKIFCYLNSPSFVNGDKVNSTPYFVAELSDSDGINASGSGIGHDLELIIDGKTSLTYTLNDYFAYDFGKYTSGTLSFSIPELALGPHRLLFRAWDILNNSSTAELTFNVAAGLQPDIVSVDCTHNPATTTTTFIINHNRYGSDVDVAIDVFDTSGRLLWTHAESGTSQGSSYTVDWDLTTSSGQRLQTGVYVYRVRMAADGSSEVSKAKKLIVISNK